MKVEMDENETKMYLRRCRRLFVTTFGRRGGHPDNMSFRMPEFRPYRWLHKEVFCAVTGAKIPRGQPAVGVYTDPFWLDRELASRCLAVFRDVDTFRRWLAYDEERGVVVRTR